MICMDFRGLTVAFYNVCFSTKLKSSTVRMGVTIQQSHSQYFTHYSSNSTVYVTLLVLNISKKKQAHEYTFSPTPPFILYIWRENIGLSIFSNQLQFSCETADRIVPQNFYSVYFLYLSIILSTSSVSWTTNILFFGDLFWYFNFHFYSNLSLFALKIQLHII